MGYNLLSLKRVKRAGGSTHFTSKYDAIDIAGRLLPLADAGNLWEVYFHPEPALPAPFPPTNQPVGFLAAAPGLRIANRRCVCGISPQDAAAGMPKVQPDHDCAFVTQERAELSALWHKRLGHRSDAVQLAAARGGMGVPETVEGVGDCGICVLGKQAKAGLSAIPPEQKRATSPLELVHCDLVGPMPIESNSGNRYAAVFTDDATRARWILFLRQKSDFPAATDILFSTLVHGPDKRTVQRFMSDNGGELTGAEFEAVLSKHKIQAQTSGPYTPQQNGVAERANRTIGELARCLMIQSGLPDIYWPEAWRHAVYLINRLPTKAQGGASL